MWQNLDYYQIELYLLSVYHPQSQIQNDRSIMKEAILIPMLLKNQLILINLVRIKLQVIFISDLLENRNNRTKEYYTKGQ